MTKKKEFAWFPDFKKREAVYEHLDDPRADPQRINRSLEQFSRINHWLSSIIPPFKKILSSAGKKHPGKTFSFLDIGAGSGDITFQLKSHCEKEGIPVDWTCLDQDPRSIAYLKKKFSEVKRVAPVGQNVKIIAGDMRSFLKHKILAGKKYDFILLNHALHHLDDKVIPGVLKLLHHSTGRITLVSDLKRSRLSYFGFALFAVLFLRGSYHWNDGLASIRRGFTKNELEAWLDKAGIRKKSRVRQAFPGRFIIEIEPKI